MFLWFVVSFRFFFFLFNFILMHNVTFDRFSYIVFLLRPLAIFFYSSIFTPRFFVAVVLAVNLFSFELSIDI